VTSNRQRAESLALALSAALDRDRPALRELLTDDVRAWSPALATGSREALLDELERRDDAFSDLELDVIALDVGGDHACAEWTVEMTHTGVLTFADGTAVEPTGIRVTVHGVTVAEFLDGRICSLRQYWDAHAVLEQLGVLDRSR
jgi:ketosteroid isomerase-like protein